MSDSLTPPDAIHWWMMVLENGARVGDVTFFVNGNEGRVTLGDRTFEPTETIDNYELAGGTLVANRHFNRYETVELTFNAKKRPYTFDQRRIVGWRWYGIRPYLRITDKLTEQERFFQCIPRGMFESAWVELTPVAGYPRWLAVTGQMEAIGWLIFDAILLGMLYWLPMQLAAPLWAFVKSATSLLGVPILD